MTNVEQYLKQLPTKLQEIKAALQGGIPISSTDLTNMKNDLDILALCVTSGNKMKVNLSELKDQVLASDSGNRDGGTQRICIATDDVLVSDIDVSTSRVANCVDTFNNRIISDVRGIGGNVAAVNSGGLSNGCQRIAIADDDTNTFAIKTAIEALNTLIQAYANNAALGLNVALNGINFGAGTTHHIDVRNSNIDDGTMRVCIADNDTNLSNINSKINTMQSDIATIKNILSDVWVSASHYIQTHAV